MGKQGRFAVFIAGPVVRLYYLWNRPTDAEPYLSTMPDSVQQALRTSLTRQTTR
jgi:hypothetical protein